MKVIRVLVIEGTEQEIERTLENRFFRSDIKRKSIAPANIREIFCGSECYFLYKMTKSDWEARIEDD